MNIILSDMLTPEAERYKVHYDNCARCKSAGNRMITSIKTKGQPRNFQEMNALVRYVRNAMCRNGKEIFDTVVPPEK